MNHDLLSKRVLMNAERVYVRLSTPGLAEARRQAKKEDIPLHDLLRRILEGHFAVESAQPNQEKGKKS